MTDDIIDERELRELEARVRKLPREIAPPADAWAAIRSQMGASESPSLTRPVRTPAFWQRPAFLAAAALMLVAGSSVITAVAVGGRNRDVVDRPAMSAGQVTPASSAPASLAEFTAIENDYISTANRLAAMVESDDTQLSPETIAKLKESLRVIDAAILEARRALAADPANRELMEMLSTSYNQKVDLLRRTTEMGRS